MTFIFAETEGMQSGAAIAASLADDTNSAGAQGQAAGAVVVPPGLDHVSAGNAARIKSYTSELATKLESGAGLQDIYGTSISNSARAYLLADELNATRLGGLV